MCCPCSGSWSKRFFSKVYVKVYESFGVGSKADTHYGSLGETTEKSSNWLWLKSGKKEWKPNS